METVQCPRCGATNKMPTHVLAESVRCGRCKSVFDLGPAYDPTVIEISNEPQPRRDASRQGSFRKWLRFAKAHPWVTGPALFMATIVGLIVIGSTVTFLRGEAELRARQRIYDKTVAFVRSRLKAPRSAEFPERGTVKTVGKNEQGQTEFSVVGEFDAQNSFGALLHGTFGAHVAVDPNTDDVHFEIVVIDDDIAYLSPDRQNLLEDATAFDAKSRRDAAANVWPR